MLPSKKALIYEILGTVFIVFLGSAFHFTYELSGKLAVVGAFSAVNESVWEHLKLAFWPSLIWLLIEYLPLKKHTNNFLTAKTLGTYLMVVIIPIVFYSYTAFSGKSIFAIDISTFVVAVIIGQLLSYKLLTHRQLNENLNKIAVATIILLAIAFILFTFYPPQLQIFRDSVTGKYGIP
jgi:ABC-type cobalamin transport system permease subunit